MIFEVFLGFMLVFLIFLILGFAFKQWFFVFGSAIILFLLTALLWSSSSVDYHGGNEITTVYGSNINGTIINSSEVVVFNFEQIEGFNKDMFALFTFLTSIAVLFISLEQKKNGDNF